ncbi:NADH-quinone oxidoreductase subunit E [Albidovulum sp.]|uniref:NADH-quinone oxidoreductase subunit E n=1 Tax=Albidovulum sp. TaxID=1872424 RepID=UPI0039B9B5CD
MLRRLHAEQPAAFAFTPANLAWARGQITKYPEGRQASAIIPLLWRAQEQEGWLSKPAIEHVADMLGMAHIRALEVATFYFMFQLQPVGSVSHIQICGTTSCMICGAGELIAVCKERIAAEPHVLSADGRFSWEEVECLGACANAPMAQIGKDYYEDLTAARLSEILDGLAAGKVPVPGPQAGRYASEPLAGLTSLKEFESGRTQYNASVQRAVDLRDTVRRIDGTEVPLLTPWLGRAAPATPARGRPTEPKPAKGRPADVTGVTVQEAPATSKGKPKAAEPAPAAEAAAEAPAKLKKPRALKAPRKGVADDLKEIKGVGPKLEALLHRLGFYHFDQVAGWTAAELAWVDDNLEGFKGRASRERWIEQARILAAGGETEHSSRVKKGEAD